MSTLDEIRMRMMLQKARHDEAIIREMLGRWVSELEPSVCYRNGQVLGLCMAGDPTGHMPVVSPLLQFQRDVFARTWENLAAQFTLEPPVTEP